MKLDRIIKTAINLAPIVYPIIKKMLDNKKASSTATNTTRRR